MVIFIRSAHMILWIAAAYKWGDWKNWSKYYSTMLFMGMGDLIYHMAFADKKLWSFNTGGVHPAITEIAVIFTIFFCTVLLFLTHYPDTFTKKLIYTGKWIILYIVIEIIMLSMGMQTNANGWSIWWSLIHNCYQFPLIALHYKKPYKAWIIAIGILIVTMNIFGIRIFSV